MASEAKITGGGKGPTGKKTTYDKALDTILKYPRTRTNLFKEKLFKYLKVSTQGYEEYYGELRKDGTSLEACNEFLEKVLAPENKSWIDYSSAFMKWSDYYKSGAVQPDHKDYTNISMLLRDIYDALLLIKNDLTLVLGQPKGEGQAEKEGMEGYEGIKFPHDKESDWTSASTMPDVDVTALFMHKDGMKFIDKTIETYRRLFIIASALKNVPPDLDELTPEMLNFIIKDYIKWSGIQYDSDKTGNVDVQKGVGELTVQITSKKFNEKIKGDVEAMLGRLHQLLMGGDDIEDDFESEEFKRIIEGVPWGDVEGSKAIKPEIIKQLKDSLIHRGRITPYKSKTNKSGTLKSKSVGTLPLIKISKLKSTTLVAKGRVNKEGGNTSRIAALHKLRNAIQKRLPAEIRRQMGRPALINRTGRFSNSAQLLNLRETAKGISGEYTYRLNPYQTFENTGSKRWPMGYNPKPLIAKSIRKLALQYTGDRLVSLRRI